MASRFWSSNDKPFCRLRDHTISVVGIWTRPRVGGLNGWHRQGSSESGPTRRAEAEARMPMAPCLSSPRVEMVTSPSNPDHSRLRAPGETVLTDRVITTRLTSSTERRFASKMGSQCVIPGQVAWAVAERSRSRTADWLRIGGRDEIHQHGHVAEVTQAGPSINSPSRSPQR